MAKGARVRNTLVRTEESAMRPLMASRVYARLDSKVLCLLCCFGSVVCFVVLFLLF